MMEEITVLIEEDKQKATSKTRELCDRAQAMQDKLKEVERLEAERERLDGLLVKFADTLTL